MVSSQNLYPPTSSNRCQAALHHSTSEPVACLSQAKRSHSRSAPLFGIICHLALFTKLQLGTMSPQGPKASAFTLPNRNDNDPKVLCFNTKGRKSFNFFSREKKGGESSTLPALVEAKWGYYFKDATLYASFGHMSIQES